MLFSIIYKFDCSMDVSVNRYNPSQRHLFQLTEQSDCEPSEWDSEIFDGKVKHRKLCGILNRKQFERFLQDTGIRPEHCETMGSLGAPGFGPYIVPAISFMSDDDPNVIQCAYVTPFPEIDRKSGKADSEKNWQRIRRAIFNLYD